jgi:hypothetical protein
VEKGAGGICIPLLATDDMALAMCRVLMLDIYSALLLLASPSEKANVCYMPVLCHALQHPRSTKGYQVGMSALHVISILLWG